MASDYGNLSGRYRTGNYASQTTGTTQTKQTKPPSTTDQQIDDLEARVQGLDTIEGWVKNNLLKASKFSILIIAGLGIIYLSSQSFFQGAGK